MKKTALHSAHLALSAKMVEFAGYDMPVYYDSIQKEHMAVRNSVGVFDVSHMGEFLIKGDGSQAFLERMCTNKVANLSGGKAQYSCMLREDGGILDDLLLYQLKEGEYLMVVNASNLQKNWNWLSKHKPADVEMENVSDGWSLIAVQGPKSVELLQKLTKEDLSGVSYYHFINGEMAGVENVVISATGYTGAGGFELYVKNENALKLWEAIFQEKDIEVHPVGLGARDTLRLEMGYCLYGNDINETTNPYEAGLGWIVKTSKDFIGKEAILEAKSKGIDRKLGGLILKERSIPRKGYPVVNNDGTVIGEVTSGSVSPVMQQPIAMAYIQGGQEAITAGINIKIRNKIIPAEYCKFPFLKQ